ncbi:hypothetical protein NC651_014933 [Populus alba x Populus x berolinensis]|nr:hypothetical protein NC651_014933 [Populus alba x Populus x berolinensis]
MHVKRRSDGKMGLSIVFVKEHNHELLPAQSKAEEETTGVSSRGLRLLGLLLQCAVCVATDNLNDATDLLPEDCGAVVAVWILRRREWERTLHLLCRRGWLVLSSSYQFKPSSGQIRSFHKLIKRFSTALDAKIGLDPQSELLESTGSGLADFRQFTSGSPFEFNPLEVKIGSRDGEYCCCRRVLRGTGEVKVERRVDELRRSGFRPVSLQGNPAAQAGLFARDVSMGKGYTLVEENGCLKLALEGFVPVDRLCMATVQIESL